MHQSRSSSLYLESRFYLDLRNYGLSQKQLIMMELIILEGTLLSLSPPRYFRKTQKICVSAHQRSSL